MNSKYLFLKIRYDIEDYVLYRGVYLIGHVLGFISVAISKVFRCLSLRLAMISFRYCRGSWARNVVAKNIKYIKTCFDGCCSSDCSKRSWPVTRTIVLAKPKIENNKKRKGVVLIKFTETFAFYHRCVNLVSLLKDYNVILEPSWAGYSVPEILSWVAYGEKVLVETSDDSDYELLSSIKSEVVPVRMGSGDWVDYNLFRPLGLPKSYDVIYVANYNRIKRLHVYLKVINKLKPEGVKAALVCAKWGDRRKDIDRLIKYYDLSGNLDLYEGLSTVELNKVLSMSKVNLLLSYKEGSNRSVFEGFFSGVPCIILRRNVGVNKKNVNKYTGLIVEESELPSSILWFRENYKKFDTRKWALKNISPEVSTKKLIHQLNLGVEAPEMRYSFGDLDIKVNRPEVQYFNQDKSVAVHSEPFISNYYNLNKARRD